MARFPKTNNCIGRFIVNEQVICMTKIVIDKKKYVLIPEKEYQALQRKAALKAKPEKPFAIEEARLYSKKLIRKWAVGGK